MDDSRGQLHKLVDQLPEHALEHAKIALEYCHDPEKHRMTIERAKLRARENLERNLRRIAERSGTGLASISVAGGHTFADGRHHSSMAAFEDGKEATYHLYIFRGHAFEVVETIEISPDGEHLIRRERITGADGSERMLMAEWPTGSAG
jgi:hypothetical protein